MTAGSGSPNGRCDTVSENLWTIHEQSMLMGRGNHWQILLAAESWRG
jgi:hypothetical protein